MRIPYLGLVDDEYDAFRADTPLRVRRADGSTYDAWYVEGRSFLNRAGWHCVRAELFNIRGDWY